MFQSRSDKDTRDFGRRLGKKLGTGAVVCLYGELGTGKTTMVKGIAREFGINERDVTSPSFTIIAEYEGRLPFYHIDLYRIEPDRIEELGLHEYLYGRGITVIEWAEKAEKEIPDTAVRIKLSYAGDDSREIEIKGIDISR